MYALTRARRGGLWAAVALSVIGCNDSTVEPWPSPQEIVQRMDDNCIVDEGIARCWAYDGAFSSDETPTMLMLRDTLVAPSPIPPLDVGRDASVLALATGEASRCAVIEALGVRCWGDNGGWVPDQPEKHYVLGQADLSLRLGDDSHERGDALPFVSLGSMGTIVQVEARPSQGYFVRDDQGRIKGWGSEPEFLGLEDRQVRGDDPEEMGDALPFVDLGTGFVAAGLAVGSGHACAWNDEGALKCWGSNHFGQLGLEPIGTIYGDEAGEMGDALPFVDLGEGVRVQQAVAALYHTCALTVAGRVKCWGASERPLEPHEPPEQVPNVLLGLGNYEPFVAPLGDRLPYVDLGTDARVVALDGDSTATCALLDVGELKCWGTNNSGQLGQGDPDPRGGRPEEMGDNLLPVDVGSGRSVVSFTAGRRSCAWLDDDSIRCWGWRTGAGREPETMGENLQPVATAEDLGLAG
ncbi:MAG: hypothetical protein AAF799_15980 [Myxococcota bacterium]